MYGPPGTGKTITTRRLCREFADRTAEFAVEYVNLKECRTIFSAANEILFALGGEKQGAYAGLDSVFEGIWERLEEYPEWTVLILDEIDHVRHDANYDPSDFFYRLLRGEGKLARDLHLSAVLISNELLTVDLRLDSRLESTMGGEEVFFPPYSADELRAITSDRIDRAFVDSGMDEAAFDRGVWEAAHRWGDARKTLRLFRQAGEAANERSLEQVTVDCIVDSLEGTEREMTVEVFAALYAIYYAYRWFATEIMGTEPETWLALHPSGPAVFEAVTDVIDDELEIELAESYLNNRLEDEEEKEDDGIAEPDQTVPADDYEVTLEDVAVMRYVVMALVWEYAIAEIP